MALSWKKHPFLGHLIPSDEDIAQMSPQELLDIHAAYHEAIENSNIDPLKYGVELEPWSDADRCLAGASELLIWGGNRSSKTSFGARTVVKAALENKDGLILCFSQDKNASVRIQQRAVYEWLPAEYKRNLRSQEGYIKYSLKNGFTGDSLILPETRTQIAFQTYSQFLNNPGAFEGLELGALEPT